MTYYSWCCFGGPREVRTPGLLNAIEARSQLRYGPKVLPFIARACLACGPGGIRTPGLFSAIEARSQLRYRPVRNSVKILPDTMTGVKEVYYRWGLKTGPAIGSCFPGVDNC